MKPDGLLGGMRFGAAAALPQGVPGPLVDIPVLDGAGFTELWRSDRRVHQRKTADGLALAATEQLLFGALEVSQQPGTALEITTRTLYDRLFQTLKIEGYPHLLRTWNYMPAITEAEQGLERYRRFTLGRHEAYVAQGQCVELAPAACALGSRSGPLVVIFLASKDAGQPIENPRQISAYCYPERYGPRSPTFSRALLTRMGGRTQLFISGTASIIGHESRHPDNPLAQAEEVMTNIGALIGEAARAGHDPSQGLLLKCYIRHPAMLAEIRRVIEARIRPVDRVVYLNAEICRSELLVEVEGASV